MFATVPVTPPVQPGSPELDALLARIADGAAERDRDRVAPHEQIGWLRDAGLTRLRLPVEDGGAGATLRELFATLVALAAADPNVAHILRVHFSFVEQQLANPDPDSRARWVALIAAGHVFGNAMSEEGDRGVGQPFRTTSRASPTVRAPATRSSPPRRPRSRSTASRRAPRARSSTPAAPRPRARATTWIATGATCGPSPRTIRRTGRRRSWATIS